MENIIVIDGKEYEVILKSVEKTEDNKEHRTGYEKANDRALYFYTEVDGRCGSDIFSIIYGIDQNVYDCGNAVTNLKLGEDRARRNRLLWQLERFSAIGRKKATAWNDRYKPNYYILYNHDTKTLVVGESVWCQGAFEVYFDNKELAKEAIEKFKDELIWFFTEYQDTAEFR